MFQKLFMAGLLAGAAMPAWSAVYIGDGKDHGITIQATAVARAAAFKSSGSYKDNVTTGNVTIPQSIIPLGYYPQAPLTASTGTAFATQMTNGTTSSAAAAEDITAMFMSTSQAQVRFEAQTGAGADGRDSEGYGVAGGSLEYDLYTTDDASFGLGYNLTGPAFTNSYVKLETVGAIFSPVLVDYTLSGASLNGSLHAALQAGGIYRLTVFRGAFDPAIDGSYLAGAGITSRTQTDLFDFNITASTAPEAASWALMLTGFGLVGGAPRSRRRPSVAFDVRAQSSSAR